MQLHELYIDSRCNHHQIRTL